MPVPSMMTALTGTEMTADKLWVTNGNPQFVLTRCTFTV